MKALSPKLNIAAADGLSVINKNSLLVKGFIPSIPLLKSFSFLIISKTPKMLFPTKAYTKALKLKYSEGNILINIGSVANIDIREKTPALAFNKTASKRSFLSMAPKLLTFLAIYNLPKNILTFYTISKVFY